ncbi:MAG: tetratricopeptide repeat protein [Bacteroidota bacterium]|nr:tetratricopeptide repeat protein [Bacteroidota bacterium]
MGNIVNASKPDSLKKVLFTKTTPEEKAFTCGAIISHFETNYDSAILYYDQYSREFRSQRNKFGEGYINYCAGFVALETAKYDESKDHLNKGIITFIELKNDTMLAKSYMRLGFVYYTMGDYETSNKTYFNALEIAERIGHSTITSWAYNLIGLNYRSKPNPDYKKALQYLFKALEIDKKANSYGGNMGMVLLRIGSVYTHMREYDKAELYLNQSMRLADSLGRLTNKKWTLEAFAGLYKRKKEYKKAVDILERSLAISKQQKEVPGIIITFANLADNYMNLKELKLAETYIDSAITLSLKTNVFQTLSSVYILKSKICENKGEAVNALQYYKKAILVKDSLFSVQNSENINQLETKFQTQKKEKEITLLNKEKETDQKLKSIYIIALCVAAIFMCIIIFFLFKINRSKKIIALQKLETEKQKDLVLEKQKDITDSINYALHIQEAILPPIQINEDLFEESFILFKQKDIVSGDFYWYNLKNGKTIVTAVDCTGHGVPGALMSMLGMTFLNEIINQMGITTPAHILSELRDRVKTTLKQKGGDGESKDGMDMALIAVDKKTMKLEFCGANNPVWIFRPENGAFTFFEIEPDKRPIGYFKGMGLPFTNKEFQLKKNDRIYLFTDGYADQFGGPKGKKFKYKQLNELFACIAEKSMNEQYMMLTETFDSWKGKLEQVDDVCIIGLRL